MNDFEWVIVQFDICCLQVLVEVIIVEVQDVDGFNFGIQWVNKNVGMMQFINSGLLILMVIVGVNQYNKDGIISSLLVSVFGLFNGIVVGFYQGNWVMLFIVFFSSIKNDILVIFSIVIFDNM